MKISILAYIPKLPTLKPVFKMTMEDLSYLPAGCEPHRLLVYKYMNKAILFR